MDKFKQLIIEHKKATLIALFFLIVFIGGSAVSAINVAKHRAEQEQTEQDAPITEVVDKAESDKEVTLTDTQKKAIKNYDDDTKGFIETLSASIWSADGGRYTLRFSDNSYVETANGKSSVHSYAITRIDREGDGYGGSLLTIVFETDTGTHIVSYVDGKGAAVHDGDSSKSDSTILTTIQSASMFSKKDTPYKRAESIENITVKGLNSEITELLGGDSKKLSDELSKWCSVHYPSVTEATWNKVASIDYENKAITTGFTLNTENPYELTVIYMTESNEFVFGN